MVPAKTISVGNSAALAEGVINHAPHTLARILKTIIALSEHQETKTPVTTPTKKHYSGCKNNCANVKKHKSLLPV
ncbi:MAG TPA: hypothetical protein VF360_08400 [Candidatus Methanoperedens sp.]